jgi:hypothetical protein
MSDTVVSIVGAFFVIGILVGIVVVVAASAFRADRRGRQGDPEDPVTGPPPGSGEPTGPYPDWDWDDPDPGHQSRWPDDTDSDFSGR